MNKPPPRWLVLLVFALVLGFRLHHAWMLRFSTDADRDIAQLMSKHIAEGGAWPVFFYGQSYMGTLEPLLGAFFGWLFGVSAFTIALGGVLPALLTAVMAGRIARAIGGAWAGLFASAYFITGAPVFSAYAVNPRGGYAMMALLHTACLYVGSRLAAREFKREQVNVGSYLWLGVLAGAAWWTSGIVLPTLAAVALALLVGLRGRIWQRRVLGGLAGFAVGAAPWLIWNARHQWRSLSMSGSLGEISPAEALPLLFRRTWETVGLGKPGVDPLLLGMGLLILAVLACAMAARAARRRADAEPLFQMATPLAASLALGLLYVNSSFAHVETLRYALPLVPVMAVLVGVMGEALTRRAPELARLALLLALATAQLAAGKVRLAPDAEQRAQQSAANELAEIVRREKVDAVYAWYGLHWLNFATREVTPFVDPLGERFAPYARRALLAGHPAWLGNPEKIKTFLDLTDSAFNTLPTPFGELIVRAHPPDPGWARLPATEVARAVAANGADVQSTLLDGNAGTAWSGESLRAAPAEVILTLRRSTSLQGIKLYSAKNDFPLYVALSTRRAGEPEWTERVPATYVTGYHWSGPGLYWQNLHYALELRCPPVECDEIKISFPPSPRRASYRFHISELIALTDSADARPASGEPPPPDSELIRLLERENIHQLLANRWISDRAVDYAGTNLAVRVSSALQRGINDPLRPDDPIYTAFQLGIGTALLLPFGSAISTMEQLREFGYHPRRQDTAWGALLLLNDPADARVPHPGPMAWFGDALFLLRAPGDESYYAQSLYQQAERLRAQDPAAEGEVIERCLTVDPDHLPALARWLALAEPGHPAYAARSQRYQTLTRPDHPLHARFLNGLRLEGVSVTPSQARPGETITVTYFWHVPPGLRYGAINTFVHFRRGGIAWQDDHPVLDGISEQRIRQPPYPGPMREVRTVTIPADTAPGAYDVVVGLVRQKNGRRILAWGAGARWNGSVVAPGAVDVVSR